MAVSTKDLSRSQTEFMQQLARTYLVKWAAYCCTHTEDETPITDYFQHPGRDMDRACFRWVYGNTKWILKSGEGLSSAGYKIAASMLKR